MARAGDLCDGFDSLLKRRPNLSLAQAVTLLPVQLEATLSQRSRTVPYRYLFLYSTDFMISLIEYRNENLRKTPRTRFPRPLAWATNIFVLWTILMNIVIDILRATMNCVKYHAKITDSENPTPDIAPVQNERCACGCYTCQ